MRAFEWILLAGVLAGCASLQARAIAPDEAAARDEARPTRPLFTETVQPFGGWQLHCVRVNTDTRGTCVMRASLNGAARMLIGPAEGFVVLVAPALQDAAVQAGTDESMAPARCIDLPPARRACLWSGESGRRIVAALGRDASVRVRWTAQDGAHEGLAPREGFGPGVAAFPQAEHAWQVRGPAELGF
jgi:hypothetical protein